MAIPPLEPRSQFPEGAWTSIYIAFETTSCHPARSPASNQKLINSAVMRKIISASASKMLCEALLCLCLAAEGARPEGT
jgi:hypothetical protein